MKVNLTNKPRLFPNWPEHSPTQSQLTSYNILPEAKIKGTAMLIPSRFFFEEWDPPAVALATVWIFQSEACSSVWRWSAIMCLGSAGDEYIILSYFNALSLCTTIVPWMEGRNFPFQNASSHFILIFKVTNTSLSGFYWKELWSIEFFFFKEMVGSHRATYAWKLFRYRTQA